MRFPWQNKSFKPSLLVKSASWIMSLGALRTMQTNYDQLAAEGYAMNWAVNACVSKIATSTTSTDLLLFKRKEGGKVERIYKHKILDLLERPNPQMSGRDFLDHLTRYLLIGGNTYVHGVGMDAGGKKQPKELYLLPPGKVTVNKGSSFIPKSFTYLAAENGQIQYTVDQITGASSVLHIKLFNPIEPWKGMSPLVASALGVDLFNEGQKWNLRLLQNGAQPTGALVVKGADGKTQSLTDEQYKRLQQNIEEQMSGSSNAGRPMLLEGGLEWQQLSMTAKDMDFKESMLNAARGIAAVYGVPPMLINIPGESTYANFEQARMALWTDTVLPGLSTILDALNRWLIPLYGDNSLFLWYDEDMVPALEPIRKAKAERINSASYMSINEKRRAMGLEDIEGGEVVLVPSGNIPLELAGGMDLPEEGSEADKKNGKAKA